MQLEIGFDPESPQNWPERQPILETERLILRSLTLSDARGIQSLAQDFEVADTVLDIPHFYRDGLAEEWIVTHSAEYAQGAGAIFGVTAKAGTIIGVVGISVNSRFRRGELGYWMGKAFWNQGYATEAARAVVEFGFSKLGLHKIEASHFSRNPASGRVMRKVGFVQEGVLRDHIIKWDCFEDVVVYGMISPYESSHTTSRNKSNALAMP